MVYPTRHHVNYSPQTPLSPLSPLCSILRSTISDKLGKPSQSTSITKPNVIFNDKGCLPASSSSVQSLTSRASPSFPSNEDTGSRSSGLSERMFGVSAEYHWRIPVPVMGRCSIPICRPRRTIPRQIDWSFHVAKQPTITRDVVRLTTSSLPSQPPLFAPAITLQPPTVSSAPQALTSDPTGRYADNQMCSCW